jgi:predicted metal-dependent HD superfamily phosphohydrolase
MMADILSPDLHRLADAWQELVQPFGADPRVAQEVAHDLVVSYSGPERYYHNLNHIAHVLETIQRLRAEAHDLAAVRLRLVSRCRL